MSKRIVNLFFKNIKAVVKHEYFILAAIFLLALILRLINIGEEDYWGDEIFTLGLTKNFINNFSGLIDYLENIWYYPPLYLILLKFWTHWFGYAEAAVRSLSLIFGLGVIIVSYFFIKYIFQNKKLALLCAFLLAVLPIQIEFSQEARGYIMICFWGVINIFSLWLYLEKRRFIWLVIFAASAVLGLYTHYSFALVLISTFAWWTINLFIIPRKTIGKELIMILSLSFLIFVLFYPWVKAMIYDTLLVTDYKFSYAEIGINNNRPDHIFESRIENLIWATKEKSLPNIEIIAAAIFKALFFFIIILGLYRLKKTDKYYLPDKKILIYIGFLFSLITILYILSPQSVAYGPLNEKHMIVNSVLLIIIIAYFLTGLELRVRLLILSLLLISLLNFNIRIVSDDTNWDIYHQTKGSAEYINSHYLPGDIVVIYTTMGRTNLNFYLRPELSAIAMYPMISTENDWYYGRLTSGFLEMQSHFRQRGLYPFEEEIKLKYIVKKYNPKRIWFVDIPANVYPFSWLDHNNWKHAIYSMFPLFPVNLYINNEVS